MVLVCWQIANFNHTRPSGTLLTNVQSVRDREAQRRKLWKIAQKRPTTKRWKKNESESTLKATQNFIVEIDIPADRPVRHKTVCDRRRQMCTQARSTKIPEV